RRSGDSSARPAPMHAPAMTSDALGRMNSSIRLGRKKAGRPKATTTGSQRPRRSENGLSAGALVGICRVRGTVYYLHAAEGMRVISTRRCLPPPIRRRTHKSRGNVMSTMYPFERFTERAKKVLTIAQEEAERSHHS